MKSLVHIKRVLKGIFTEVIDIISTKILSHKRLMVIIAGVLILGSLLIVTTQSKAATATIVPDGDVTAGWALTGGANDTTCAGGVHCDFVDEGTTPNTVDYIGTGTGGGGGEVEEYTLGNVTNVTTASSVTVTVHAQSTTNANGGTLDSLSINLRVNGTLQTAVTCTPSFNTWADCTATFNGSWTQSDIDSLQVHITRNQLGSGSPANQDDDVQVANVYADVTYIPGVNFEQSAYRWFENNDTVTNNDEFVEAPSVDVAPSNTSYGVDFSSDGTYLAIEADIYKRSGDSYTKLPSLADPPGGTWYASKFSHDDTYLVAASTRTPYIYIYKRSGDTFTKLADPATLPSQSCFCRMDVAFSPDNTYLSITTSDSPRITIYKRSGDTFTKLADPATLPTGISLGTSWSPDGTYMTVAHEVSPFITIYKRSGDTFTKLADPATLPTGIGNGTAWSPDGTYMTVAHSVSPYITIYKRSGDTFTKLANPATLPAGTGREVTFSPDGTYMTVAHSVSPYITIYKRSGDTFTKLADPPTLPEGTAYDVTFSSDSLKLGVAHAGAPYISIYKNNMYIDAGNTMAPQSTPATAPSGGIPFRLRMNMHGSIAGAEPGSSTFKLQYAARGVDNSCDISFTNETYTDVSDAAGDIRFYNNTNGVDGLYLVANANDPTHNGHSITSQTYEESNNFGISTTIPVNNDGMWDFALVVTGAPASTTYCFRAVYSTGATLETYTVIPEITTASAGANTAPAAPTLTAPTDTATDVADNPQFQLSATDSDSDYLQYRIEVCSTSNCSSVVRTIDQTLSQTGWSGQNTQTSTAYTSGTTASHTYQAPLLTNTTQYWWRAYAIDPGGTNTWSSASSIFSFTTEAAAPPPGDGTTINGGVEIRGGTSIGQ